MSSSRVGMSSKRTSDVDLRVRASPLTKRISSACESRYTRDKMAKRRYTNRNSVSGIFGADELLVDQSVRDSVLALKQIQQSSLKKLTAQAN